MTPFALVRPLVGLLLGGLAGGALRGPLAPLPLGEGVALFLGGVAGAVMAGRPSLRPFVLLGWVAGALLGGVVAQLVGRALA